MLPILVVPKPDGTGRLCVDYRKLNNLTEPDPFPMPRIDALLDWLGGAMIMTKLDMTRGYWQVPLASSDRFRDITRSLSLATPNFSRLVTKVFKGLEEFCEAYLDDIMVFSRS